MSRQGDLSLRRNRVVISSADRVSGSIDRFAVNINTADYSTADGPVLLHLDYTSPLFANSKENLNYYDSIGIYVDNLPQHSSYDTRTGTSNRMIGMLARDQSSLQTSTNPADANSRQAWTYSFDHDPILVSQDVWQLKNWQLRLAFCNEEAGTTISSIAAKQDGDILTLNDFTLVCSLVTQAT